MNNMFGAAALPVRKVDFDDEDTFDAETFASNPAFQSDTPDDDIPDVPEEVPNGPHMEEPPTPQESEGYFCDGCGVVITEKVYEYSLNKYGRPLCVKCQRGGVR